MKQLIDKLYHTTGLEPDEYKTLIDSRNEDLYEYLAWRAREVRTRHYGHGVYIRGLIEFTNYCRNDCFYCGIRKSNKSAQRYRLTDEQILECCRTGYELGFRTFVLQGGEDGYYTDEKLVSIIRSIKEAFQDCAVTLSIGERSYESYKAFYDAGADRYLLRHETADESHYAMLHPEKMSLKNRKQCLYDLKQIGTRWMRIHGGVAVPDHGPYRGGSAVHKGTGASHGRDRAVHTPSCDAVCRKRGRDT